MPRRRMSVGRLPARTRYDYNHEEIKRHATKGGTVYIDHFQYEDSWQDIKNATMNTIGKNTGRYPDAMCKQMLDAGEIGKIQFLCGSHDQDVQLA
ncbi:MAG: hypothetical protein GX153_00165 [Clostridiaceae bacterium]|nr:hypothetical protein [Clostridiaceae bacterium]